MTKLITTILLLLSITLCNAQYAYFGNRGKITFDKITFTKARVRSAAQNSNSNMMRQGRFNLDNIDESTTKKMVLFFDENSTLLTNQESAESSSSNSSARVSGNRAGRYSGRNMARVRINQNTDRYFYQDLKNNTSEVQLEIDEKYIIKDTLNNITWRFTDEYREIAGFECRRVNGSTPDSLYLVAFYTDQIPVSAGPALSSGLPGMILGLAIPEMHIQYWATQVDYTNETVSSQWRDKKATKLSFEDFVNSFGRFFQPRGDSNDAKRQVQEQLIY